MTATPSQSFRTMPRLWLMNSSAIRFCSRSRARSCRICASTVTSSAVVGSSRISSGGSQASAAAIRARCFIPPLNWWGKACATWAGRCIPMSCSSAIARSFASGLDMPRWRTMGSAICAPIRSAGFSAVNGSWNTDPMRRPRIGRRCFAGRGTRSVPSNRTCPSIFVSAPRKFRIAPAMLLLPDPDSPTMPRDPPASRVKEASRTAGVGAPG